jgi:hypothetical protein
MNLGRVYCPQCGEEMTFNQDRNGEGGFYFDCTEKCGCYIRGKIYGLKEC